jgi:hemolysin III
MLALSEVLLRHCNGPLRYVKRLDFSVSGKQVPKEGGGARGFKSHGAVALAKVLQVSQYIVEVRLPRNSVGPYGASAIFLACVHNPALRSLGMRRCRVGERGALVLAETLRVQGQSGGDGTGVLREIDLSANYIGQRGCKRVEQAIRERNDNLADASVQPENLLTVDLEGNLVFPEVMNAVTHGLGLVLAFVGAVAMSRRSAQRSHLHVVSCAVYSISLIVLYTSSTLYHSFFTMQNTKYIFEVVDKCAIYVLIAGSYTPFLQIVLNHEPMWSTGLLSFIWTCGILGILVEAFFPMWRYRKAFSLAMYLGMGWAAIVCLPEAANLLPDNAIRLLVLGGVAYTSGVPFYVRSNNLDHAIWHLFVLAGSIFHWVGIYLYVAVWRIDTTDEDAPRFATCSD